MNKSNCSVSQSPICCSLAFFVNLSRQKLCTAAGLFPMPVIVHNNNIARLSSHFCVTTRVLFRSFWGFALVFSSPFPERDSPTDWLIRGRGRDETEARTNFYNNFDSREKRTRRSFSYVFERSNNFQITKFTRRAF